MVVTINVKLLMIDGSPSAKTVINLKELRKQIDDETFAKLFEFMTIKQKATLEKFNGKKEVYTPFRLFNNETLVMPRFMFQKISDYLSELGIEHKTIQRTHISIAKQKILFGCKFGNLKIDIFKDKVAVIDKIITELESRLGLIVKLDTGKGKSVIIAETIRRLGLKAHIITKDKTLQRQIYAELHSAMHLDDREDCKDCLAESGGSYCKYVALLGGTKTQSNNELLESGNYKILISVINSARLKPPEFWKPFGITFIDECPTCTSEKFSEIFEHCQSHYMVGLSATPDDKWNSIILEHNIGKIIDYDGDITANGVVSGKVYKIIYDGPPEYTRRMVNSKGIVSIAKMVKQFMGDPDRNELIIKIILDAVSKHEFGFVFAMRNDFLRLLKQMLDEECQLRGLTIVSVVLCADSTNDERRIAYHSANVIFTNYAFGTGVNIVHTRFEVHASPYKNGGKQITGRILRKDLDDERFFYDIIDNKTQLRSQFESREEIYKLRGLTIVKY